MGDDTPIMGITTPGDVVEGSDQGCRRRCITRQGAGDWFKAVGALYGFLSADGKAGLLVLVTKVFRDSRASGSLLGGQSGPERKDRQGKQDGGQSNGREAAYQGVLRIQQLNLFFLSRVTKHLVKMRSNPWEGEKPAWMSDTYVHSLRSGRERSRYPLISLFPIGFLEQIHRRSPALPACLRR